MKNIRKIVIILLVLTLMFTSIIKDNEVCASQKKYVKSLVVSKKNIKLIIGKKEKISYKVKAKGNANKKIKIKVTNSKIASVKVSSKNTIVIKAKKTGSTKCIISTIGNDKDGKKLKKELKIKVIKKKESNAVKPTTVPSDNNNSKGT